MSELKAYTFSAMERVGLADYYLKSEADKVIADLIEKNERLSDDCLIKASNTFREIEKEIRHHEYKRCLAMAEWCNANCMHTVLLIGHKIMPHWEWRIKTNYWYKWRKIWFEISRKFKDGKLWQTQTNL